MYRTEVDNDSVDNDSVNNVCNAEEGVGLGGRTCLDVQNRGG